MEFELIWANPHWPMWYLSALFFWRLMTPILKRMPGQGRGLGGDQPVAGLYATNLLDNARIFGLLPFFVLGLKMHEGHWNLLRARRARWYGIAVLLAAVRRRPVHRSVARVRVVLLPLALRRRRPRQPARDRDPDVAADRRPGGRVRLLRGGPAHEDLVLRAGRRDPGRLPVPRVLRPGRASSAASRAGPPTTAALGRAGDVLAALLALFLAWRPVSSRLTAVVDPIGTYTRGVGTS